jgi:peptide deformylase
MTKQNLLILLVFGAILFSCSTGKRTSERFSQKRIFSEREKKLILSGKATEPMRVWLITNYNDSVLLRKQSAYFQIDTANSVLKHFSSRLLATVKDSATRGVGIAAPQVGILKRIIWVQRLDKPGIPFEVYYNPVITKYSDMKQDVREGCLSIPGIRDTTHDRSYAVFIQYDTPKGEHKCEMIEAFTAAIFQHEIDHLNGILFIDHLKKESNKGIKHSIK